MLNLINQLLSKSVTTLRRKEKGETILYEEWWLRFAPISLSLEPYQLGNPLWVWKMRCNFSRSDFSRATSSDRAIRRRCDWLKSVCLSHSFQRAGPKSAPIFFITSPGGAIAFSPAEKWIYKFLSLVSLFCMRLRRMGIGQKVTRHIQYDESFRSALFNNSREPTAAALWLSPPLHHYLTAAQPPAR